MIEGGRGVGSFGRRRVEDRPAMRSLDALGPAGGDRPSGPARGSLSWALRTAALVGLGSLLAAQLLIRHGGPATDPAPQLAEGRRVAALDPETTGAIGVASGVPSPGAARCGPLIACLRAPPTPARP